MLNITNMISSGLLIGEELLEGKKLPLSLNKHARYGVNVGRGFIENSPLSTDSYLAVTGPPGFEPGS
ncbi:MAG: hypothetical protein QXU53_07300, partial [Thermosphaera sp.]